jgi:hypothetical protein
MEGAMSAPIRTIVAAFAAFLLGTTTLLAANDAQAIKKLMGDNFESVHKILNDLVTSNYGTLPADVGVIRSHAEALAKSPPASIKVEDDRLLFIGYAIILRSSADALIAVTAELVRRDKTREATGELKIDYLRAVAASHFGTMITQCVLCHNQFRRAVVPVK